MDWSGINKVSAAIAKGASKAVSKRPKSTLIKGESPNSSKLPKRHWSADESRESQGR